MPRPKKSFLMAAVMLTLFGLTLTTVYYVKMLRGRAELDAEGFAVAKVLDKPVTRTEFQATLNRMMLAKLGQEGVIRGTDTFELRLQAFDSLVKDSLLKQWAVEEGMLGNGGVDTKIQKLAIQKVDRLKGRIAKAYNTDNPEVYFEEFVKAAGFPSVQAFIEDARIALLEEELAKKLFPDVKADRGEVLRQLPWARARQIYIPYTSETRDQVRQQMEGLLAQIRQTPVGSKARRDVFVKLAYDNSLDDATRNKGGDLGFLRDTDIGEPVMREKFVNLKQGEVSDVFSTGTGYHILYVEFRPEWNKKSEGFKEIIDTAAKLLVRQKQKRNFLAQFQKRLSELVSKNQLTILDPLLDAQNEDRKGNFQKALELYEAAGRLNPKDPYINMAMAEIHFRQDNFALAKEHYEKAIEKRNDDPYLYVRRAKYYIQMGQVDEAALDLSVASNLAPTDYQLHGFLENIYRGMGMLPEAQQEHTRYIKAVERIYGNLEAYKNQERIKEGILETLGENKPFSQKWLEDKGESSLGGGEE